MNLIASYRNKGFESVADGVMSFFDRRTDLHHNGIAFSNGSNNDSDPAKISTDISLVAIDRTDPEAFALSEVIVRGVDAGLKKYLQDRPLFNECSQNNHYLSIQFSTYNVMPLEKDLKNGIVTGRLAKKQPNRFIEF